MAEKTMDTRLKIRGDTASNWSSVNPTLLKNEVGYDETNKKFKIGDGATPWNSLNYIESGANDGSVNLEPIYIGEYGNQDFEIEAFALDITAYQKFLQNKTAPIRVGNNVFRLCYLYDDGEGNYNTIYELIRYEQGFFIEIGWYTDGPSLEAYYSEINGSELNYVPEITSGVKVGTLLINGDEHEIYAPEGGGSSGNEWQPMTGSINFNTEFIGSPMYISVAKNTAEGKCTLTMNSTNDDTGFYVGYYGSNEVYFGDSETGEEYEIYMHEETSDAYIYEVKVSSLGEIYDSGGPRVLPIDYSDSNVCIVTKSSSGSSGGGGSSTSLPVKTANDTSSYDAVIDVNHNNEEAMAMYITLKNSNCYYKLDLNEVITKKNITMSFAPNTLFIETNSGVTNTKVFIYASDPSVFYKMQIVELHHSDGMIMCNSLTRQDGGDIVTVDSNLYLDAVGSYTTENGGSYIAFSVSDEVIERINAINYVYYIHFDEIGLCHISVVQEGWEV